MSEPAVRVARGAGWEVAARPPRPALGAYVRRLVGFTEETAAPLRRLELPSSAVTLIIGFDGDGWDIAMPGTREADAGRHLAFAAGLHGTAAVTEQSGRVAGVQVDLTPLGAHAVFAVSPGELAGRVATLEEAAGTDAATRALPEGLASTGDWERRLALVEAWLAARAAASRAAVAPPVAWALRRLRDSDGAVPVAALCEAIGWSRRHLAARFRAHVGVTPKALGRLLRFERAVGALRTGTGPADLGRLALDCGYYDQAHFNRDFRAFAGISPGAYVALRHAGEGIGAATVEQVTSVQDPAAAHP